METTLGFGVEVAQIDTLDDARKRAQDALRKATGPMHVPQPDGSIARRCYLGRLQLACERMDDPAFADKREAVQAAIVEIAQESDAAWAAYKAALGAYYALGGTEPILARECRCEVCLAYEGPTVHMDATSSTIKKEFGDASI